MKIFTWMNRKSQLNVHYCMISHEKDSLVEEDKKLSPFLMCNGDREGLLHQRDLATPTNTMAGILNAGTFRLHRLNPLPFRKEEGNSGVDDGEEDDNVEELNCSELQELKKELEKALGWNARHLKSLAESDHLISAEEVCEFLAGLDLGGYERERKTLAELFHAHSAFTSAEKCNLLNQLLRMLKRNTEPEFDGKIHQRD